MGGFPLLSTVLLSPIAAAILLCFISKEAKESVRIIAAGAMTISLALTVFAYFTYDISAGGMLPVMEAEAPVWKAVSPFFGRSLRPAARRMLASGLMKRKIATVRRISAPESWGRPSIGVPGIGIRALMGMDWMPSSARLMAISRRSSQVSPMKKKLGEEYVCVFVPWSLNMTSGTNLFVAKKDVIYLDISSESALQYLLTAGAVMGREYALLDGETKEVAAAIYEHYMPRFAGDSQPQSVAGRIVSLADKIDNIVATFSRGLIPTGSQDPFALRRQALGMRWLAAFSITALRKPIMVSRDSGTLPPGGSHRRSLRNSSWDMPRMPGINYLQPF